jgi:uncharacterized protein
MVFVFDTNTLVSAILKPESVPMMALKVAQTNGQLIFTEETKSELLDTIARTKFDKYLPRESRLELAKDILIQSKIAEIDSKYEIACRDEKDIKFLRLAGDLKIDFLISGDKDLTILHPYRGIPILTPSNFLNLF